MHIDAFDARRLLSKSRLLLLSDRCSHLRLLRRHDVGNVRAFFQLLSNMMTELVILFLHLLLLPKHCSLKESRLGTLSDRPGTGRTNTRLLERQVISLNSLKPNVRQLVLVSRINVGSERAIALKLHVLLLFAVSLCILQFASPNLRILKQLLVMRTAVPGTKRRPNIFESSCCQL